MASKFPFEYVTYHLYFRASCKSKSNITFILKRKNANASKTKEGEEETRQLPDQRPSRLPEPEPPIHQTQHDHHDGRNSKPGHDGTDGAAVPQPLIGADGGVGLKKQAEQAADGGGLVAARSSGSSGDQRGGHVLGRRDDEAHDDGRGGGGGGGCSSALLVVVVDDEVEGGGGEAGGHGRRRAAGVRIIIIIIIIALGRQAAVLCLQVGGDALLLPEPPLDVRVLPRDRPVLDPQLRVPPLLGLQLTPQPGIILLRLALGVLDPLELLVPVLLLLQPAAEA